MGREAWTSVSQYSLKLWLGLAYGESANGNAIKSLFGNTG
jgi:hypothetical protein